LGAESELTISSLLVQFLSLMLCGLLSSSNITPYTFVLSLLESSGS
jgi:hypothetical protein